MACESGGTGPSGPERGFGNAEPGTPTAAPSVETNEKKGRTHAEPGFTLRPGESLEFAANVTKLNSTIANLKIVTAERRNFYGKNSWHLQAFARTENPYRMVFELDDQFDSYSEAGNFASQQYEMHLSERGQKVDSVQRMVSSPEDPAPADATAARVPAGTRDPLGLLQYLRGIDWDKTPEINSPVYDGRKFYEVRAVLLSKAESGECSGGKLHGDQDRHPRVRGRSRDEGRALPAVSLERRRAPSRPAGSRAASSHGARGTDQSKIEQNGWRFSSERCARGGERRGGWRCAYPPRVSRFQL